MSKLFTFFTFIVLSLLLVGTLATQTVPPAPTDLKVEPMMNSAKLQWNGSNGASGYKVYKALDTLPFMPIAVIRRMTNFIDPFVPPGHIYKYYVTALNFAGESAPSNDVVFIPGGPPPNMTRGFIAGTIIDDNTSLPIGGVRVRFFKTNGFMYFREARTDSLGYYLMPIDTGRYFVYATQRTYIPEWFDNALTYRNATSIIVTKGDTSIANFGLAQIIPPPPPQLVTVSGTVTDSLSGTPIKDAFVAIMRTTHDVLRMQNQEGSMFGNRSETSTIPGLGTFIGVMRVVKTDSAGSYSVQVPDSLRCIMLAYKAGYIPEFYNNKRTPFDADRLFITGNTSGINFDLIANPALRNSLSGVVKNVDGDGVISRVVLFNKTSFRSSPVRFAVTDTSGNYSFNNLYPGYYYAKAVPFAFYAPAWHDNDSCGTFRWVDADSFLVSGNTTGIDICVKPITRGGFANISGTVTEKLHGDKIQGVTVYALASASNSIIDYDITENDGTFDIQNLAPGSYTIVVDKEGYNSPETPTYIVDASQNYTVSGVNLSIASQPLGVDEKGNSVPVRYSLEQNYPNPFNPTTSIEFQNPKLGYVSLKVFNLLGQEVATLLNEQKAPGTYRVMWDAPDLASGVYFYQLHGDGFTSTKKLLLMR
jgi:hypothetical protein